MQQFQARLQQQDKQQNRLENGQKNEQQSGQLEIDLIEHEEARKNDATSVSRSTIPKPPAEEHRWLQCMDRFAEFIGNVSRRASVGEAPTIALIDDGVNHLHDPALPQRISGGRSFSGNDDHNMLTQSHCVSDTGHGTLMASLICRVCPTAKLFVIKLEQSEMKHIDAQSAAKAVQAAVDRNVDIISMSWTIPGAPENASDIKQLENAIINAANADILMFCSASDQAGEVDRTFPAACAGTKNIFKIGAAEAPGTPYKYTSENTVDFLFPGHKVVQRYEHGMMADWKSLTGSSVATALAAGLAALILYCTQVAASHTPTSHGHYSVNPEDHKNLKQHARMHEALSSIGNQYRLQQEVFRGVECVRASDQRQGIPSGTS